MSAAAPVIEGVADAGKTRLLSAVAAPGGRLSGRRRSVWRHSPAICAFARSLSRIRCIDISSMGVDSYKR
jgi:hypothetical protein